MTVAMTRAASMQVEAEIESLLARQAALREQRDRLQRLAAAEVRAPRADWQQDSFPWSRRAAEVLRDAFGLHGFRCVRWLSSSASAAQAESRCNAWLRLALLFFAGGFPIGVCLYLVLCRVRVGVKPAVLLA